MLIEIPLYFVTHSGAKVTKASAQKLIQDKLDRSVREHYMDSTVIPGSAALAAHKMGIHAKVTGIRREDSGIYMDVNYYVGTKAKVANYGQVNKLGLGHLANAFSHTSPSTQDYFLTKVLRGASIYGPCISFKSMFRYTPLQDLMFSATYKIPGG